jgi:hypothetical protein
MLVIQVITRSNDEDIENQSHADEDEKEY